MSRRIITSNFNSQEDAIQKSIPKDGGSTKDTTIKLDAYFDKLIKNIPADVVAGWIAVKGAISSASNVPKQKVFWISFVLGVIITFLWTFKQTNVKGHKPAWTQITISTGAFVIWVIATGAPFNLNPLYGTLLIVFYTFLIPIITPPES